MNCCPTMVLRTVIRITSSEASMPASAKALASIDPINYTPTTNQISKQSQPSPKPKTLLCNRPSCAKRAQHPSPLCWMHGAKESTCSFVGCKNRGILLGLCPEHGGLVQLCRHRRCINEVNLEKRGGLCRMHQVGPMDDSDYSEDDNGGEIRLCSFRGCISDASTDEGLCDRHSTLHDNNSFNERGKGAHPRKRKRIPISFVFDLSDVPPQPPIPKSEGRHIKEGASRYTGVSFNKQANKWQAEICIEGKQHYIGQYKSEEDAAVNYARAVFKYRRGFDLSDVPPQPPIPKSGGHIEEGASKYTGVTFSKLMNKWQAQISIEGKQHYIGQYKSEEDAAVDYARAVYKYKGQGALDRALDKAREQNSFIVDLGDVPPQPPIIKSAGHFKEGASKYVGVSFNKQMNKWQAQIMIEGKQRCIGYYENEEAAAIGYARAVYKYKGQGALDRALDKAREQKPESLVIDLSDVPPQPPIPKSDGRVKEGASKYTGVSFRKQGNNWVAQIMIEGKQYNIGYYENEEEAAVDYARAVYKYKGQGALDGALDKTREQNSFIVDLGDVPPQPPILRSVGRVKEGASRYTGVCFNKQVNKWNARIMIEGKERSIGCYEDEEEAAVNYARAVYKYKGEKMGQKSLVLNLSDVPPQPPILKSDSSIKDGASKYRGVNFNKKANKWNARIMIEGKLHYIGHYENDVEAAVDYARAVFKYKGKKWSKREKAETSLPKEGRIV